MKAKLTIKQSRRLIELGVPTEKASGALPNRTFCAAKDYYDVFTITDLLEILPKDEYTTICFRFLASTTDERGNRLKNVWCAEYDSILNGVDRCFYSPELIDALFELVVWCVENGYLKTNEK